MKLIIAIIQPYKLEAVMEELDKAEIHLKTVSTSWVAAGKRAVRKYTAASKKRETC